MFRARGASGGSGSCPYVIRTGDCAGQTCRKPHTRHRCFSRLDDAWRAECGDEAERPRWAELLRSGVAIFDLDYDAILAAMYALSVSAEGDCYACVPPDPGIEAAALGASESSLPSTTPAEALHTFTLDSSASRCFFRDSTTLTPLSSPVPVRMADTSGGPVLARSSIVLQCLTSLPPLPPSPAPPCLPCVEGRQRVAPHSSSFPPMTAPLQTLHMDVWGPACISGQGHERYFVLDLPVLRLHSDRGGEFSSDLLRDLCCGEGILQSFTLLASPQQNGIDERRIGLVMEVARTSMIHAAAPHFLWPFAVRYAVHQLNLWPRVSLPETSPTLRWTGEVGDASVFRAWGSCAFVRDTSADKLSTCAIPCIFLGLPLDTPGWQLYHPTSHRVLPSQDVTFDECVSGIPSPWYCAYRGVASGGAAFGGAELGGAESEGAGSGGAEPGGVEPGGAEPAGVEPWAAGARDTAAGDTGAGGVGAYRLGGAGVTAGVGGTGGAAAAGPGGARTRVTRAAGTGAGAGGTGTDGAGAGGAGAADTGAVDPGAGGARAGGTVRPSPIFVPLLRQRDSPQPAPSPYADQTDSFTERREPESRLASPVCAVRTGHRAPCPRPPCCAETL
ncbi:unnamed protein product [Closterium sp. NIES-54]